MYGSAVVAGKFYPFHFGHWGLINKAATIADRVDVILVVSQNEQIDPRTRALAIYESFHPFNLRVHIVDDIYTDDTTERGHQLWADYTAATLGYLPDVVVASEDYGRGWAKQMGADFVMYDHERIEYPVSGTKCRANAHEMSEYMPMATKRYMLPRIVVLGAESTGTTTLASALGKHYQTEVVPEYGRIVSENEVALHGKYADTIWDDQMFWLTSRAQDAWEERLSKIANGLLICDTSSFATAVWYDYFWQKKISPVSGNSMWGLLNAGKAQAKKHTLYILTWDDIPFVQDSGNTRTGALDRRWHTKRFCDYLYEAGLPFIVAIGPEEKRLAGSINAIDTILAGGHVVTGQFTTNIKRLTTV
jgi:HTH-type transcriptional regulator, transcriptional repressor of NAD biosynthesis genes